MTTNSKRLITIAVALLLFVTFAAQANAFCCGGGGYSSGYAPYTSYYSPYTSYYGGGYGGAYSSYYGGYGGAYSSYYAPASYSTSYSGWYPGYWWDRARVRLWGAPSTYVASYPNTYAASYAPAYSAGYATSYAAPGASCCAPCSTCASYAPACGCSTCESGCSSCSSGTVTQASYGYSQPSCCGGQTANYGSQYAAPSQPQTVVAPPGTTVIQQNGAPAATTPQPNLNSAPESTYRSRPPESPSQPTLEPQPGTNNPYDVKKDNGAHLEAPKLFSPQDRTAQRSIAPVRTAVYEQPASYRPISTAPITITAEQARQDAIGWSSSPN